MAVGGGAGEAGRVRTVLMPSRVLDEANKLNKDSASQTVGPGDAVAATAWATLRLYEALDELANEIFKVRAAVAALEADLAGDYSDEEEDEAGAAAMGPPPRKKGRFIVESDDE